MAKNSVELREERATIISEARTKWTDAEARDGGPTAQDQADFDAAMDGADKLLERARRLERLETAEDDLDAPQRRQGRPVDQEARDRERADERGAAGGKAKRSAYGHWLRTGEVRSELRDEASRGRSAEFRDTVISTDSKGGFLVVPTEISSDIVSVAENFCYVRQLCQAAGAITTVTDAKSLGIRKKTAHMSDANWTTEVQSVTEDTSMAFDRRDLTPNLVSKLALVSIRTLMLAADAEGEVTRELGYMFGVTEEKAFLTGSGTAQPLGVFTASANGISTNQDVTASATTTFSGDDLINLKYSITKPYRSDKSNAWIVSRAFVKIARTLKVASAGQGDNLQYIWQPGLTEGAPDRILDIPYYESEYAPNTFTTGLYVAVLGAFRYYRIAQLAETGIQRLVERYADTNQVGFIGRRWVDGSPIIEQAFARLKLA